MIQRGDIVLCALQGDYGKPRPAVVIQSDVFNETHDSITLCPLTSHLINAGLFRVRVSPSKSNGIKAVSEIMIDKIMTIKRDKIREKIGQLTTEQVLNVNDALRFWQDLN